jgi:hypothetical protein
VSAFAGVLTFAAFTVWTPAPLPDLDACIAEGGSAGTVESVSQVAPQRDLHSFDEAVLSHPVRPEPVEQLVVRLDAGPLVIVSGTQARRLHAGERVRVQLDQDTPTVERCLTPVGSHSGSTRRKQT